MILMLKDMMARGNRVKEMVKVRVFSKTERFGIKVIILSHRYIGSWKNDMKDGPGVLFHINSQKKYDGVWKNNKRHGLGKSFFVSGGLEYYGDWDLNQMKKSNKL